MRNYSDIFQELSDQKRGILVIIFPSGYFIQDTSYPTGIAFICCLSEGVDIRSTGFCGGTSLQDI